MRDVFQLVYLAHGQMLQSFCRFCRFAIAFD